LFGSNPVVIGATSVMLMIAHRGISGAMIITSATFDARDWALRLRVCPLCVVSSSMTKKGTCAASSSTIEMASTYGLGFWRRPCANLLIRKGSCVACPYGDLSVEPCSIMSDKVLVCG
jgi:hypothetical protein